MQIDAPDRSAAHADVCAVLITFHPDGALIARLSHVLRQVRTAVVVDNGSTDAELEPLLRADSAVAPILIRNFANLGIARALNIGVARAAAHGCAWALLLDQDTQVDTDMVQRLLEVRSSCPDGARVAIVGSRYRDPEGRATEPCRLPSRSESWEEVESVITSGSLLSLSAYAAIGPFRDDFFIDYVDTEYCFRARAAGFRIIETLQPLMSHTVGAPTSHVSLWGTTWTSNHSPDRRYYIARNNTVLLREYGTSRSRAWRWKSLARSLRLCKRILYYERDKRAKILAVAQGWWHGVRGTMGPRPDRRPST